MNADDCLALGKAALERGEKDRAYGHFRSAAALDPGSRSAQFWLGVASAESGRDADALEHYWRCLELGGGSANLYSNIGAIELRLNRTAEAEASYRQAIAHQLDHPEACAALGRLLHERGDFDAALELYNRAARDPQRGYRAAFHRSQILLARGDLRQGFKWYASRPNRLFSPDRHRVKLFRGVLPPALPAATVLVLSERTGIGEDLFFARFLPLLKTRGARVVFQCSGRARELLDGHSCIDAFAAPDAEPPPHTYALLAGDLPYALQIWEQDAVPPPLAISIREEALREAHGLLGALGPRPFVGLTWRAGTEAAPGSGEWVPLFKRVPLDALLARAKLLDGTLFALQRNVDPVELEALRDASGVRIHDLSSRTADLVLTLALAAALDHYICVPNTHLHLRVAAGRPAHVLEPFPPDWRFELEGPSSRWYPGCRVYRQTKDGRWDDALAQLAGDLASAL